MVKQSKPLHTVHYGVIVQVYLICLKHSKTVGHSYCCQSYLTKIMNNRIKINRFIYYHLLCIVLLVYTVLLLYVAKMLFETASPASMQIPDEYETPQCVIVCVWVSACKYLYPFLFFSACVTYIYPHSYVQQIQERVWELFGYSTLIQYVHVPSCV